MQNCLNIKLGESGKVFVKDLKTQNVVQFTLGPTTDETNYFLH